MEPRKKIEIEYYDKEAEQWSNKEIKEFGSRGSFNPFILKSYVFLKNISSTKIKDKIILDYGCGSGNNLDWLSLEAKKVVGVDLSEKSLKIAEQVVAEKKLDNVSLVLMDCEKMEFPDSYFDAVFDGGTFSSLDTESAFSEIKRVLKPEGFILGIETFGHNPFTNFKRKINKIRKKRTEWADSHILKENDLEKIKKYFGSIDTYYFHLISWITFPFMGLPGGVSILRMFESVDNLLISIFPFLKKYSFKIVFVVKNLKNDF